ncbi:MAG TPA: pyocin knob domain-containing protein, partial [Hyphomicrobium sp.]|nr:pyocin knob domain-containing protein [Hyphomicrobium sp.]
MSYDRHRLPNAPETYSKDEQDRLRAKIEELITNATRAISGMSTGNGQLSLAQNELKLVNGGNHNIPLVKTTYCRLIGPTGSFSLTGIADGAEGCFLILRNTTAQSMTILNESEDSYAENRIITPRGNNLVLSGPNGQSVTLIYDTGVQRWVVVDQGDYVERAGDTMTGPLTWGTYAGNIDLLAGAKPGLQLHALATGATNGPTGAIVNGSIVETLTWGADTARQVYFEYATDRTWNRSKAAGTWGIWVLVWDENTDGAGSGLDADLLDGQHGSYYTDIPARLGYTPQASLGYTPANKAGDTITGKLIVDGHVNGGSGMSTATGGLGDIEVRNSSGGAAFMTFHRVGSFAAYFGIDNDNVWRVGGWSMGGAAYGLWHDGNYAAKLGSMDAGGVGTYLFGRADTVLSTTSGPGTLVAGANLRPASVVAGGDNNGAYGTFGGTWRLMGYG